MVVNFYEVEKSCTVWGNVYTLCTVHSNGDKVQWYFGKWKTATHCAIHLLSAQGFIWVLCIELLVLHGVTATKLKNTGSDATLQPRSQLLCFPLHVDPYFLCKQSASILLLLFGEHAPSLHHHGLHFWQMVCIQPTSCSWGWPQDGALRIR